MALLGGSDFEGYRKESHLMLIGEADTGKSEMVKFANTVASKSSMIDGSNSTGVGILFALDEYDGMKILRQGAMILNNGGHLMVDEYDKMPKQEQKKLNVAMEQQRAKYNKGGHMGDAECKTTVIASCNPESERWNEEKT
jgi:DNA replicative helicase MCM subunit Mcm2 (Cdc46/Mcm family)